MVKPEEVFRFSLSELVEKNEEGRKELDFLENNVIYHLFSNYPERRRRALRNIRNYLGNNIDVRKIEKDKTIWAYLGFRNLAVIDKEQYIFVGGYAKVKPFFEPALEDQKNFEFC